MANFDLDALAPEAIDGVHVMPILHERVDIGSLVRCVLEALQPAAVAVELPITLSEPVRSSVSRLPEISVVLSEEEGEDTLIWVVAPGDPLVEGLRWAEENGRQTFLIDPDLPYPHRHTDIVVDPWSLWTLGAAAYLEIVRALAGDGVATDADRLRERGMAHHLLEAKEHCRGPVLALVGAAHASRLTDHLKGPTAPPLARQRRSRVAVRNLHPDSLAALLPDAPLVHAVFENLRDGVVPGDPGLETAVARPMEMEFAGLRLITGGDPDSHQSVAVQRCRYAASRGHREGLAGRPVADREAIGRAVWEIATASWRAQTREEAQAWQRRMFFDFAHRHARIQGQLVPGLYEWVTAARGVADDNLAWETFETATAYPWQQESSDIQTARIDGEMLDLGTRRVRFRRRFFRTKRRPVLIPVRRHPTPDDPTEWLEAFDGRGICSYPPEDVVIEDYGLFLQKKAVSILASETARSEPFVTSMLDGIDLRETLLHWHEGRIWVRERGRSPGAAGSVVVIFDDDPDGDKFPYVMTWLGEHDQESDMALYATDPTRQIVGPGIMRATYGGFMLTYPPGRLFDVWGDPDYRGARFKAETLLMAAVDYSTEKIVVQVAPNPPSSRITSWAAQQGKRIVHIPIGSLSPVTLRRVRVLHILAGYDKRAVAKDYIW